MTRFGAAVLLLMSLTGLAGAQSIPRSPRTELMVLTGAETGTYYQMGRDVKRLVDEVVPEVGIELAVVPSQGAIQNVIDVFRYKSMNLAITQSDVLSYLEIYAKGDPAARRVIGGLQMVGHMYHEDVYLFARPGINSLADLSGKRVDIGPPGSGTTVTALVLMHLARVEPREIVNFLETASTISALRSGRIDAFFRVVATPADDLREGISASHGFVLVPIRLNPQPDEAPLAHYYQPSTVPAGAYAWLDHPVDTVKIRTAVVTAGAAPGTPACDAIGRLVRAVREHRAWLLQNGHPKWKDWEARAEAEMRADRRLSPCVTSQGGS
jgi:uncharacterized protein